jgi:hypothetical protein
MELEKLARAKEKAGAIAAPYQPNNSAYPTISVQNQSFGWPAAVSSETSESPILYLLALVSKGWERQRGKSCRRFAF